MKIRLVMKHFHGTRTFPDLGQRLRRSSAAGLGEPGWPGGADDDGWIRAGRPEATSGGPTVAPRRIPAVIPWLPTTRTAAHGAGTSSRLCWNATVLNGACAGAGDRSAAVLGHGRSLSRADLERRGARSSPRSGGVHNPATPGPADRRVHDPSAPVIPHSQLRRPQQIPPPAPASPEPSCA